MKPWLLVLTVVACTVLSDVLQSREMKQHGEVSEVSGIGRVFRAIFQRGYLLVSIVFMAISFFAFLALLQISDLSFAVPATALTYVADTMLARLILKEKVDARRWAGSALVAIGVYLLAL